MMKVVIRRVLVMPFLLLGIVTATFILAQFTKGNPLVSIIGARALNNPEIVAAAKARWGLDRSVPERYAIYIWNLAHGDLGTSFRTKQPVLTGPCATAAPDARARDLRDVRRYARRSHARGNFRRV